MENVKAEYEHALTCKQIYESQIPLKLIHLSEDLASNSITNQQYDDGLDSLRTIVDWHTNNIQKLKDKIKEMSE